ncbi:hypothetical protein [Chitinophaga sp. LS1]|uniref:hypothetical protein n=1 Tax=Chitinophaga sp. LS1 TaxID=3051176 RepID=UPI002AABA359|nr:hypothetical protein [Chitinophaga sp. LS1]WPV67558.1 hypothetical protein QQL36_02315 [Chitinophaga sp. LS1]
MENFYIGEMISPEVGPNLSVISIFNEKICSFLKERDYGSGVLNLVIGFICMNPKSLKILKLRKPSYVLGPKIIKTKGLPESIIERNVEYEFIADFQSILNAQGDELIKRIKTELINSIVAIDVLEIPDFDKEKFKKDFIECVNQIQI